MDAASAPAQQGVQPSRPAKKRTGTSKYDFIKVKVWLGENLDHYYILSRFLICRMLTVTRIPYIKAVKIALETKKHLVDNNLHDVTQAQLEEVLFSIIREKGFDEAHIDCYRMVTQFYQSRQPLCIIICGAAWTGKSTLAQQLASRINIPNVMQTDVIYELLRAGPDSPLNPVPLWARPGLAGGRCCDAALVREFRREARVVREGMEGDLIKTLSDGKPIIIEGLHLDPGLYIPDLGSRGLILLPARPTAAMAAAAAVTAAGVGLQAAAAAGRSPGSSPQVGRGRYGRCQTLPARPSPAAVDAAGFAASVAGGDVSLGTGGEGAADGDDVSTQQQQQDGQDDKQGESEQQEQQLYQQQQQLPLVGLQGRSVSAAAEVSVSAAGPLSPGSLQPGSGSVSAEAALGLLRSSAAATYAQQQQQQGPMPQQQQGLLRTLEESSQQQQQLPSLPPLPPLRLHRRQQQQQQQEQNLLTMTALNGHAVCTTSSSGSGSSVQTALSHASVPNPSNPLPVQQRGPSQQGQHMGTPFADAAAANAAAAVSTGATAGDHAAAGPAGLCSSPDGLPVAMTGEEVQVCAAAAEAAALQQHRQELQASHQQQLQQQQQQGRHLPGSPFSSASDVSSVGVGGGSPPCISQEHSTTEVVSRVCSCASLGSPSLPLSQEPSGAADVWSAAAAGASVADGVGCGALLCKQSSGSGGMGLRAGGFHTRSSSARVSSRQLGQLPEEQHGEGLSLPQQQPGAAAQRQQQQVQQSVQQQQQQQPSSSLPPHLQPQLQPHLLQQLQHSKCNGTVPAGVPQPERQPPAAAGSLAVGADRRGGPESVADRAAQRKAARHAATPRDVQANGNAGLQQHVAAAVTGADGEASSCQVPAQQQPLHPQLEAAAAHGSAAQPASVQLSHPQQPAQQPDCQHLQQQRFSQQQPQQQPQQQQQQGMPPPEPCISSDVGKAKAGQEGEPNVGKPLFVPILVYMDEADHALMADEALSHLGLPAGKSAGGAAAAGGEAAVGASGDGDSLSDGQAAADGSNGGAGRGCMHDGAEAVWQQQQSSVTVDEALRRVRLLQEYLCAYEAQGLPVVKVSYGAFGEALDKLHEYVLQCIKVAMQSREAASE